MESPGSSQSLGLELIEKMSGDLKHPVQARNPSNMSQLKVRNWVKFSLTDFGGW